MDTLKSIYRFEDAYVCVGRRCTTLPVKEVVFIFYYDIMHENFQSEIIFGINLGDNF